MHFVYDAALMSLPLFVSEAHSAMLDKIIIFALVLSPVGTIFIRKLQTGEWCGLESKEAYNADWKPDREKKIVKQKIESREPKIISPKTFKLILCGGMAGLIMWLCTADFQETGSPLKIDRNQAEALAKKALIGRGINLDDSWRVLSTVNILGKDAKRFFREEEDNKNYSLLSYRGYLCPPLWKVRFARFNGTIKERAEEYFVYVIDESRIFSIQHKIPENKSGISLDEKKAEKLAYDVLREKYLLTESFVKQISVESNELPARKDWTFVFSDEIFNNLVMKIILKRMMDMQEKQHFGVMKKI